LWVIYFFPILYWRHRRLDSNPWSQDLWASALPSDTTAAVLILNTFLEWQQRKSPISFIKTLQLKANLRLRFWSALWQSVSSLWQLKITSSFCVAMLFIQGSPQALKMQKRTGNAAWKVGHVNEPLMVKIGEKYFAETFFVVDWTILDEVF